MNEVLSSALVLLAKPRPEITVKEELDPNLPEVPCDREQMRRVFVNVIGNSLDAMAGGGELKVQSMPFEEGGRKGVLIKIEDSGGGIDEEHMKNVFTPYFTTKEKGTGLGLAIVHRIVTEHGGRIEVESRKGKGTSVSVILLEGAKGAAATQGAGETGI